LDIEGVVEESEGVAIPGGAAEVTDASVSHTQERFRTKKSPVAIDA